MSFTLEQARELRKQALEEKKKQRKVRVDQLVEKSMFLSEVEESLRKEITMYPERQTFYVIVLDVVTNDWDDPNRKIIREEVIIELLKKYEKAFYGCKILEIPRGNNSLVIKLSMCLCS